MTVEGLFVKPVIDSSKVGDRSLFRLPGVALFDADRSYVEGLALGLLTHPDRVVRTASLWALGHLARIHRSLDETTVRFIIGLCLADPLLAGVAEETLEDLDVLLG